LQKRQLLHLFGNIIQWLPIIAGAAYTFFKFSERQYQQNVGGRILTSLDYIREGVVASDEINALWDLSQGSTYPLTDKQRQDYLRDGIVVLQNFLTERESHVLDKVMTHNLNEMAFLDLLTKCSRKFQLCLIDSCNSLGFPIWSTLALDVDVPYMVSLESEDKKNVLFE
jgi:hypothetical protein